jgi:glycosyltransferase involved in cell wall biosynthesis
MKFLLVSPFTDASGSSVRFWNMAKALSDLGHRVVLAERRSRGAAPLHRLAGVTYFSCPSTGKLLPDIAVSLMAYVLLLLRHRDCEVFYALKPAPNNGIPALLAKLAGKRVFLDVDDLDFAYLKPGFGRALFRWFFDRLPSLFELVTYHTPRLAEYLRNEAGIPPERLYYFAQGVSPEFLATPLPDRSTIPPKSIIYTATLGITSDFGLLLPELGALCGKHPDLSITIVGDGCRKAEFERSAVDGGFGRQMTFTGTLPHSELPSLVARHRIGINYMRDTRVNQCRAILKIREYLACGLEVVCNEVGDVALFSEYIHLGTTVAAMIDRIETLLCEPVRDGIAGRSHIINHYQWSTLTDAFLKRISGE